MFCMSCGHVGGDHLPYPLSHLHTHILTKDIEWNTAFLAYFKNYFFILHDTQKDIEYVSTLLKNSSLFLEGWHTKGWLERGMAPSSALPGLKPGPSDLLKTSNEKWHFEGSLSVNLMLII